MKLKNWKNVLLLVVTLTAYFSITNAQSSMTITLSKSCSASSLKVGDLCEFTMSIGVPPGNSTTLYVEVFTSDLNSTYAQLCKPTIIPDTVSFPSLTIPPVQMVSDFTTNSQFDRAVIDFGTVTNINAVNASYINIKFNVVIIKNTLVSGSEIWITAGAEYFSGSEVWVGQVSVNYTTSSETGTVLPTGNITNGVTSVEIGKSGSFEYVVNANSSRSYSLIANAISNSPHVTACTVHVKSADWCYTCLNSVKAYLSSTYDSKTGATLDLGNVVNAGANGGITNNSTIRFFITFRVLDTATVGSSYTVSFRLNITNSVAPSVQTATHTFNVVSASSEGIAPIPTITSSLSKSSVSIYDSFRLRLTVSIPSTFSNLLKLDVIGNTTDGSPRMKICYMNVTYAGENVPCSGCLNTTSLVTYSASANSLAYDRLTWQVKSIQNTQLRSLSENSSANDIIFDVYGQLIENSNNTINSNVSVLACFTYGNQSLWIGESFFTILSTNYTSDNDSMPSFSISYADSIGTTPADVYATRLVYFDIITKPNAIYQPMNVEIVMPETVSGNNIPAATVCKVQVLSVGKHASCVQPGVINYESNGQVTYFARMIRWRNDKALVQLGSVCNFATTQTDDTDGQIRLLLYLQLEDHPTAVTDNYIGVGVQYTAYQLFVGHITLSKTATPTNSINGKIPYYYFNTSTTNTSALAGTFATANLVFKVPPNTKASYNFETKITSSLSAGTASFCTLRFSTKGNNVPCNSLIQHNYNYNFLTQSFTKNYDYAYAGILCNINNKTVNVDNIDAWDDDSVNIEVITKSSKNAVGSYTLTFGAYDASVNASFTPKTFTWYLSPNYNANDNFTTVSSNVSFVSVDLNTNITGPSTNFYKGQTTILRYTLILNEAKNFDLSLQINSTLSIDTFDLQKFFISSIGDNLPCSTSKLQTASFLNGTYYPYAASIPIGPLCYFPIDPTNVTASTLVVEAHIRIPTNSTASSSATFTVTGILDGQINPVLTKSITGAIMNSGSLVVPLSVQNITLTTTVNTTNLTIHNNVTFTSYLNIPPSTSVRVKYRFQAIDNATLKQFGHITFANITSVGRNVDGFARDFYSYNLITASYFAIATPTYYNDTVEFDLGIVTNTLYTFKMDNYNPNTDDLIVFTVTVMITDNPGSNHNTSINAPTTVVFGSNDVPSKRVSNALRIIRTGLEQPVLTILATITNSTFTFVTNSTLSLDFTIQHDQTTTAEAYNVTIGFFLPVYVTISNSSVQKSPKLSSPSLTNNLLTYTASIIYFGEVLRGSISFLIDSSSTYTTIIQTYGASPVKIDIPYNSEYQKLARTSPIADPAGKVYFSPLTSASYIPQAVNVQAFYNTPLKSLINVCQLTASVNNAMAQSVFTTGWKTDYRANKWYTANSNYLTISFGNLTNVAKIVLRQYLTTPTTTPFLKFRISYSNDSVSYALLPEDSYPVASIPSPYTYTVPNGFIRCRFLRIHLTSIETPASLTSKNTGFIIDEIYGSVALTDRPLSSICPIGQATTAAHYVSRSVLYLPNNLSVFVCDEVPDRSQGLCYSSTNANPTNWQLLPPTVSTVVFWVRDLELLTERVYGVGMDKNTYVRSDDAGLTWKSVSQREFTTVLTNGQTNTQKFVLSYYTQLPTTVLTAYNSTLWTADPVGVYYNQANVLNWFN